MKRILLLLVLLLMPLAFAQVECFRPPVVDCEGAQEVIDCMWENEGIYLGSGPGFVVNLLYDFWIDLDEGEECVLDLKGGLYGANVKAFLISGGPDAKIVLRNGTIGPILSSAYYGVYVTPGVKDVVLENLDIVGFKSGLVGGHGLSLVGTHNLWTRNVNIFDNGIGIATSGSLHWISENSYVWANSIGLWTDNYFGGTGTYTTWICNNVIDVDIGGVLDLAGKSFRADVVVPSYSPDYSTLFESCTGFVPPTDRDDTPSNGTCPDLPRAVAKADIQGGQDCLVVNESNYNLAYSTYAYKEGRYTLIHVGENSSTEVLGSSYIAGYTVDSMILNLSRGPNTILLDVAATNTNECGTDSATDSDYLCLIYQPGNCTAYVDSVSFNGQDMANLTEFTVYMHSPAYLNVSATFSGNYSSCYLYLDGQPVVQIDSNQTTLNTQLVFTQEGDHKVMLTCTQDPCNSPSYTVHVRRANNSCANEVDITNMPSGACVVVRNISSFTAALYANSENTTSTLSVYLNGDLIHSSSVSGPTSVSVPFATPDYGQYNLYAEISDGQCFDSDFGCIIVEPAQEECNINLDGYLPNGFSYVSGYLPERFAFHATSNYNLECELRINGSVVYTSTGTDISYDNTFLLGAGTYDSIVHCYAPSQPSCSKTLSGSLTLQPSSGTCDLSLKAELPSGFTNKSEHNISWNATSSQDIRCVGLMNYTTIFNQSSTSLNFFQSYNLSDGQYYWQLYCYQVGNEDCSARYESRLNVSLTSPPPEACYIYLYGELPSGTYINETNQTLWYTAVSNTPMDCFTSINSTPVNIQNNVYSSYFNLTQLYGWGSYLFEVTCQSLLDPACMESRVSSMYVVNETTPPMGICNITLNATLPSGTYNGSWSGEVFIDASSSAPIECNYSLNSSLRATFNLSYGENLSLGMGDYIFSVVCVDLSNPACVESAVSSLHVNLPNATVPSNLTCVADISLRDLPDTRCVVVDEGEGYLVRYNGFISVNGTLSLYHNDNLVKRKRISAGHFTGSGFVDLTNGTNTFMVRIDGGSCGAVDSGCVYLGPQQNKTTCEVGVDSRGELRGTEFEYQVFVYNRSQCMVFKDGDVIDRFNVTEWFTKTYLYNLTSNHTFKITCVESYCQNTSEIEVEVSPECEASAYVYPSNCEVVEQNATISYQLYSNQDYIGYVWIGDLLVESGGYSGLYQNNITRSFAPGIYNIKAEVVGSCNATAQGCLIVKDGCVEGANLTLDKNSYKIEGSQGQCYVYVDGKLVESFTYEGAVIGNISGEWKKLTIACEDEQYCPVVETISESPLYVRIFENATGLKLTPEHNSTNIHYELQGDNATCRAYLDGMQVYERYVSPGIHSINLSFSSPGIYGLAVVCNSTDDRTSSYEELLVYYVTTNDTNPPNILLIFPPNNSVWEFFPREFVFLPLDDLDPRLNCRLNIYDYQGELVYTLHGEFDMGRRAHVPTQLKHRLEADELYYWNVTCVDDGDPVGYSETWVFGGVEQPLNQTTSNFIYPNQTTYYTSNISDVKIYYGVNSTFPSVNSTVLINNLPIIPWTELDSHVLYATYVPLPPGEYNLSIVSYVNGTYVVNKTTFEVVLVNNTFVFYNNLSSDSTVYRGNQTLVPVRLYYNVTHNLQSSVNSTLFLNNQSLFTRELSVGSTYTTILYLPNGTYYASLVSQDSYDNIYRSNISFVVLTEVPTNQSLLFYNFVNVSNSTFSTNQTAIVPVSYGVVHSNQSAVNSSLFLNETKILEGDLQVDIIYNLSLSLEPGKYNITLVSVDNNGRTVISQDSFTVIKIKDKKEDKELEADEQVLPRLLPPQEQQAQPQIISNPWGGIGVLVTVLVAGGLVVWLLWRKKTVVVELLEEPHVGAPTTFIVKQKSGGPIKNAMLVVIDPDGKEITLITDQNGVASFIPKKAGVYTVKPVKYKPAPESVINFMVKE